MSTPIYAPNDQQEGVQFPPSQRITGQTNMPLNPSPSPSVTSMTRLLRDVSVTRPVPNVINPPVSPSNSPGSDASNPAMRDVSPDDNFKLVEAAQSPNQVSQLPGISTYAPPFFVLPNHIPEVRMVNVEQSCASLNALYDADPKTDWRSRRAVKQRVVRVKVTLPAEISRLEAELKILKAEKERNATLLPLMQQVLSFWSELTPAMREYCAQMLMQGFSQEEWILPSVVRVILRVGSAAELADVNVGLARNVII
jgi:hypothetical protein